MNKTNPQTLHQELEETLSKATNLITLRSAYTSFKRRIDCLNDVGNEKARALYWKHKHRIFGRNYDYNVLPHELKGR